MAVKLLGYKTYNEILELEQNDKLTRSVQLVEFDNPKELFEFVTVPGGAFLFGPKNVQYDKIVNDFSIMKYEVTNQQYCDFLNRLLQADLIEIEIDKWVKGDYKGDEKWEAGLYAYYQLSDKRSRIEFRDGCFSVTTGYEKHPVAEVTWFGAWAFADFYNLELPTEEEWEKAARSTDGFQYAWGNTDPDCSLANYKGCNDDTLPIGSTKGISAYGAYDMNGNVWEWTNSFWNGYKDRKIKGGDWDTKIGKLNFGIDNIGYSPQSSPYNIGFRCIYYESSDKAEDRKNQTFCSNQIWSGFYTCSQGLTDFQVIIESADTRVDSMALLTAVFNFDWNCGKETGSYSLEGNFNFSNREVYLKPVKWINRNGTYRMVGLSGIVTPDGNAITGNITSSQCKTFKLFKVAQRKKGYVYISGGEFEMGCLPNDKNCDATESPRHLVSVDSFYLGETEVTTGQFAKFLEEYGSDKVKEGVNAGEKLFVKSDMGIQKFPFVKGWFPALDMEAHPMVHVTWFGAAEYCRWAGGRLPTEEEWEYAARGGCRNDIWPGTSNSNSISSFGWYKGNSNMNHPVKQKSPNAFGLYDMLGNAAEWCGEPYYQYPDKPKIKPDISSDTKIAVRGHAFSGEANWQRCSSRFYFKAAQHGGGVGFRVCIPVDN